MWPFGRRAESRSFPPAGAPAGDETPRRRKDTARLGRRGEQLARKELRKRGLKILARNYRCPAGEADLIVLDPATRKELGAETIAFVEVKTRASDRYAPPESAVNADKRRRMRRVADYYLSHRPSRGFHVRFDIVSVVLREGQGPEIRYIPGAF
jgi:putative endonuclease